MKKFLLVVSAIVLSLSANAQFWAGGILDFGTTNYKQDGAETELDLKFAPIVGYALQDNFDVYLKLGLGVVNNVGGEKDYKTKNFVIAPFARYSFLEFGDFSLFVDGGLSFTFSKSENLVYSATGEKVTHSTEAKTIFVGLIPGIKWAANDKLTFVASLGKIGYTSYVDKYGKFDLGIGTTGLSIGAYYSF